MALTPEEQARLWFQKQEQLRQQMAESLAPDKGEDSPAPSPPAKADQTEPQPPTEPLDDELLTAPAESSDDGDLAETPDVGDADDVDDVSKKTDEPDFPADLFAGGDGKPVEPVDLDQPVDFDTPGQVDEPVDLDQPDEIELPAAAKQTPASDEPVKIELPAAAKQTPADEPVEIKLPETARPPEEPDAVEITLPDRAEAPSEYSTMPDIRLGEMAEQPPEQDIEFDVPGFGEIEDFQGQDPSDADMEYVLEDLAQTVTPDDDSEPAEPPAKPTRPSRRSKPSASCGGSAGPTLLLAGAVLVAAGWLVGLAVQIAELLRSLGSAESAQGPQALVRGGIIAVGLALTAGWWLLAVKRPGSGAVFRWLVRVAVLPVAMLAFWPTGSLPGLAVSAGALVGFVLASLLVGQLAADLGRNALAPQLRLLAGLVPLGAAALAFIVRSELAEALQPDGMQRTASELLTHAVRNPVAASALLGGLCLWQAALYIRLAIWTHREKARLK